MNALSTVGKHIDAAEIAAALGGRRSGEGWQARCPAHADSNPSLSIRQCGKHVLVKCHAGCTQIQVIEALKARDLWHGSSRGRIQPTDGLQQALDAADRARRIDAAWNVLIMGNPADSSPAEAYLRDRGILVPIPSEIWFSPATYHPLEHHELPAMMAEIKDPISRKFVGVHLTFLQPNGTGKATVEKSKITMGVIRGGVVPLAEPTDTLALAEGIETALSFTQLSGIPCWAAVSAGNFATIHLPERIRKVVIAADHDERGLTVALQAADRWRKEGRRVGIAFPPPLGADWNDIVTV